MTWFLVLTLTLVPIAFFVGARLNRTPHRPVDDALRPEEAVGDAVLPMNILDKIGEGVVVVNEVGTPTQANEMARRLLGMHKQELPARLPLHEIDALLRRSVVEGRNETATIDVRAPERRSLSVKIAPLEDGAGAILAFRDVTQEALTMQIRRQFVAHASHELKSPVASLQTLAEAVERAVVDDPEAAGSLATKMKAEAERLGRLVKGLLDLSKLEDPATVSNRTVDLSTLTSSEVEGVTEQAERRTISVSAEVEPDVRVRGDDEQLRLLVRNLLDNALRYTPAGGTVSVRLAEEADEVSMTVSDTGIGIPLRDQSRIFERFYRVDDSRSRASGGTGLGLAIVKHVAEMHGGLVTLRSELGEGSTFEVVLPGQGGN